MTTTPARPTDHFSRMFLTALATALVLVVPLRGIIETTTLVGSLTWLAVGLAAAAWLGLLTRVLGTGGISTTAATTAVFVPVAGLVAIFYHPGDDAATASLAVGVPVAAVSALVVATLRPHDDVDASRLALCLTALVSSGLTALLILPFLHSVLEDEAEIAAAGRQLEGIGLLPYLPAFDGLELDPLHAAQGDSYVLTWGPSRSNGERFTVIVRAKPATETEDSICDAESVSCTEGEGFVFVYQDGDYEVRAVHTGVVLVGTIVDGPGDTPSLQEVGEALAGADIVDWGEVIAVPYQQEN